MGTEALWLPAGHHWDLNIEHKRAPHDAGPFTGGGWKLCWHITVSPWQAVDAMVTTVVAKSAEPHFVIGGRASFQHPVVVQLLPLNVAGRSLQHTLKPETNRANVIQVEICAWDSPGPGRHPEDVVAGFGEFQYEALANLAGLIEHRVEVPRKQARSFQNTERFGAVEFVNAAGHHGHMHVPGNDHSDPTTAFRGGHLMNLIAGAPHAL